MPKIITKGFGPSCGGGYLGGSEECVLNADGFSMDVCACAGRAKKFSSQYNFPWLLEGTKILMSHTDKTAAVLRDTLLLKYQEFLTRGNLPRDENVKSNWILSNLYSELSSLKELFIEEGLLDEGSGNTCEPSRFERWMVKYFVFQSEREGSKMKKKEFNLEQKVKKVKLNTLADDALVNNIFPGPKQPQASSAPAPQVVSPSPASLSKMKPLPHVAGAVDENVDPSLSSSNKRNFDQLERGEGTPTVQLPKRKPSSSPPVHQTFLESLARMTEKSEASMKLESDKLELKKQIQKDKKDIADKVVDKMDSCKQS